MKKILFSLLVFVSVCCFISCGNKKSDVTVNSDSIAMDTIVTDTMMVDSAVNVVDSIVK